MPKKAKTLKHPEAANKWKENLRSFSMKVGFHINLSRTMLELLCAVADDVAWDRGLYHQGQACSENWLASTRSLEKRGMIERKSDEERERLFRQPMVTHQDFYEHSYWQLTPAGKCIVQLLKQAGMFIEADAAISKKARHA